MTVKELLEVYNPFGHIIIKDTNRKLIDVCRNGNLVKNLFGNKIVHKFYAMQDDEIKIVIEEEK